MRRVRAVWAVVAAVVLIGGATGQAMPSALAVAHANVIGGPFDPAPGAPSLFYWSGVATEVSVGTATTEDNQYDPSGNPWANTPFLMSQSTIGSTMGQATIQSGQVSLSAAAALSPGQGDATAAAFADHWVDFETSQSTNSVGVHYDYAFDLQSDAPSGAATGELDGLVELRQWHDGNGNGIREDSEWRLLDFNYLGDGLDVAGIDSRAGTYSDDYWFPSVGPGVYSLRFSGAIVAEATAPVPAPGALLLGVLGAGAVGWLRRRRTL